MTPPTKPDITFADDAPEKHSDEVGHGFPMGAGFGPFGPPPSVTRTIRVSVPRHATGGSTDEPLTVVVNQLIEGNHDEVGITIEGNVTCDEEYEAVLAIIKNLT